MENRTVEKDPSASTQNKNAPTKPFHYFTQWDVNERDRSPEEVAASIVKSERVSDALVPKIAAQIRFHLFEAGIACPVPPSEQTTENLREIRIKVKLGNEPGEFVDDTFEWDICMGEFNNPELFAQHICAERGLSQFFVPQVAQAARAQIVLAQAISYGDERTKELALSRLEEDDPLRDKIGTLDSAIRTMTAKEKRAKERAASRKVVEGGIIDPLLESIAEEVATREAARAIAAAEEAARVADEEARVKAQGTRNGNGTRRRRRGSRGIRM